MMKHYKEKSPMRNIIIFLFCIFERMMFDNILLKILEQTNTQSGD